MKRGEIDRDVDAAAELIYRSDAGGEAMLRRVVESVRNVTGGTHAYVLQRVAGSEGVVRAVAGHGGPQPAQRLAPPPPSPPVRIVIPLSLDGAAIGAVVVDGIRATLRPESHRELALLAGLAARALQSSTVVEEAESRAEREVQRQHRLMTGTAAQLIETLNQISGMLEALEHEAELELPHQEEVMRGRRSLGTALRLLSELHELGQTQAGEVVPEHEIVQLETLLRSLVQEHEAAANAAGVHFDVELATLPLARTDAACVRRILENLLSNAVRYAPPGTPITVRARVRPGKRAQDPTSWLRIDVVDRGPGVAEGDAVFEETRRIGRAGSPGFRLAVSRRIARLLGGDVTLQTEPGAGSTFTLWLPVESD
jgi:two-component system, OmpR family, sensor histidine kinase KdpD